MFREVELLRKKLDFNMGDIASPQDYRHVKRYPMLFLHVVTHLIFGKKLYHL